MQAVARELLQKRLTHLTGRGVEEVGAIEHCRLWLLGPLTAKSLPN
jgi:hypothetical protein